MLAELKDKSQVTIPKKIVNKLGLKRGDMFDVIDESGSIRLIPVVVYPKAKADELEAMAAAAKVSFEAGDAEVYDNAEDLIADLHKTLSSQTERGVYRAPISKK